MWCGVKMLMLEEFRDVVMFVVSCVFFVDDAFG